MQKNNMTPQQLQTIVRASIHPGIGIARLGNSRDEYFIGPETIEPPVVNAGSRRDASGAIKRQAASFRIYGYNCDDELVGELTLDAAEIEWTAHLANRKAQWYEFEKALDIDDAAQTQVRLRNADVAQGERETLVIDAGPRKISGRAVSGPAHAFEGGMFQNTPVSLGELRTDYAGRLLVLGGFGHSGSPTGMPIYNPNVTNHFANAAGWFDDTSDGPVSAVVKVCGVEIPVEPAWVVVAQPDFSPNTVGWRTLYDLLTDTYQQCGWLPTPSQVSFTRDILPVLQRLSGLQWVNKGFATLFGHGAPYDFNNPLLLAKLSRADETFSHLRKHVFQAFRAADNDIHEPTTWPWLYGDTFGGEEALAQDHLSPSIYRSQLLMKWVKGEFNADWNPDHKPSHTLDDVPLADQPAMLDRAALHFCLADAFHPGIELSWPMRHASLYSAPFRIKTMPEGEPLPDYGPVLNQAKALAADGPLNAQPPGGLSRWMALPWQVDAVGCRSGYDSDYDPYLPTFWPARVPNQVLTEASYQASTDMTLPMEQRVSAFNQRVHWGRNLRGIFVEQATQLVNDLGCVGVIEARPGIENDPYLPALMLVEIVPDQKETAATLTLQARGLGADSAEPLSAFELAGWESKEQYDEFRRIVKREDV